MCRLVGYIGAPLTPAVAVFGGSHSLLRQSYAPQKLLTGNVNADGYAVTWYPDGNPVRLSGPEPIWQNGDLERLLSSVQGSVAAAAVRNATPGIIPDPSGIAPMAHGAWTFTLNGFVEAFRTRLMRVLHAGIPDAVYGDLQGTSDTETLFLLARGWLERGTAADDAVREVIREVSTMADEADLEAQLNLLLTTPDRLVASRASNGVESNSLYVAEQPSLAPEGCLVASEPLDGDAAWREVPHGSLVTAHLDARIRVEAL